MSGKHGDEYENENERVREVDDGVRAQVIQIQEKDADERSVPYARQPQPSSKDRTELTCASAFPHDASTSSSRITLQDLPHELLLLAFSHLSKESRSTKAGFCLISQHLLPYARAELYHNVDVHWDRSRRETTCTLDQGRKTRRKYLSSFFAL